MNAPFDVGLQAERTLLAWKRTCLSLGVGSAAVVRFTAAELGVAAIILGGLGFVLAAGAYIAAPLGYRRAHDELTSAGSLPPSGLALALLTAALTLLGLACMAYVATAVSFDSVR